MTLRQEFEAWMCQAGDPADLKLDPNGGGGYVYKTTFIAWLAYQAATERAARELEDVGDCGCSSCERLRGMAKIIRAGAEGEK